MALVLRVAWLTLLRLPLAFSAALRVLRCLRVCLLPVRLALVLAVVFACALRMVAFAAAFWRLRAARLRWPAPALRLAITLPFLVRLPTVRWRTAAFLPTRAALLLRTLCLPLRSCLIR